MTYKVKHLVLEILRLDSIPEIWEACTLAPQLKLLSGWQILQRRIVLRQIWYIWQMAASFCNSFAVTLSQGIVIWRPCHCIGILTPGLWWKIKMGTHLYTAQQRLYVRKPYFISEQGFHRTTYWLQCKDRLLADIAAHRRSSFVLGTSSNIIDMRLMLRGTVRTADWLTGGRGNQARGWARCEARSQERRGLVDSACYIGSWARCPRSEAHKSWNDSRCVSLLIIDLCSPC